MTFEEFPDRIKHLVQATLPRVKVQSEVFPVYETKGDLVSSEHATPGSYFRKLTSIHLVWYSTESCRGTFRRLAD